MSKQNWTIYRYPTEEEQLIFKQLIGDAFETEALLVCCKESKGFTEYIFIYNHPTEENNNLVSFYGKVDNKKSKKSIEKALLEFATAQLTEKMILRNVNDVENLEDFPIKAKVANSIKYDIPVLFNEEQIVLTTPASAVDYKTKSQATYFFDCKGDGETKGSFCCVLQRLKYKIIENGKKLQEIDNPERIIPFDDKKSNETLPGYFILTAGHNLGNGTSKGSQYKLIKDETNFVELELIETETTGEKDAAILKIKGGNGVVDLINNRKAFKFYKNPVTNEELEEFIGYKTKHHDVKISDPKTPEGRDRTPDHFTVISGNSNTEKGDSGGAIFSKDNPNYLYGMYRELGDKGGVKYSKIEICKKYSLC